MRESAKCPPRKAPRGRSRPLLALLAAVALAGAACSSGSTTTSGSATSSVATGAGSTPSTAGGPVTGAITVSAAASLTEPFKKIGDDFKKANPGVSDVKFNLDASSTLAKQVQEGASVDNFASADEPNMAKLTDAALTAGPPVVFARNKLTIIVKEGNPKGVKSLADLATVGTVSLCGSDVPIGRYADQMLQKAGVTIPADKINRAPNVKASVTAVADGDADAAIVYATDVTGAVESKVDKVEIPDDQNVIASFPIAVIKASRNQATAQAFIEYVMSPGGQATLKAAGFLPPS